MTKFTLRRLLYAAQQSLILHINAYCGYCWPRCEISPFISKSSSSRQTTMLALSSCKDISVYFYSIIKIDALQFVIALFSQASTPWLYLYFISFFLLRSFVKFTEQALFRNELTGLSNRNLNKSRLCTNNFLSLSQLLSKTANQSSLLSLNR